VVDTFASGVPSSLAFRIGFELSPTWMW